MRAVGVDFGSLCPLRYGSRRWRFRILFNLPLLVVSRSRRRATRMASSSSSSLRPNDEAADTWQELSPDAFVAAPCLIEQTL
jgi:hypothetical protein